MASEISKSSDDDEESGGEGWLTTFADLSMLLLTFFILLLSMSTIDKRKFSESFSAVRQTFGGDAQKHMRSTSETDKDTNLSDLVQQMQQNQEAQKNSFNNIRSFISQNAMESKMSAVFDDGTITLRMPAEVLFDPASEDLKPAGKLVLMQMRDMFLKNREQSINIKGYTDDSPLPAGARFKDNWELSALRSVNVLRALIDGGIDAVRLTATGLGDLNPLAPNTTPENKAMNRRVEFVLERRVSSKNAK